MNQALHSSLQALQTLQANQGASFIDVAGRQVPAQFRDDSAAIALLTAASPAASTTIIQDCSHWGRILVSGGDRLRFLHNQSTNAFQQQQPGEGCDTVFVTSTARTVDLATAYVLDNAVLLLVSPGNAASLIDWMDRFIFFADQVELRDVTAETAAFRVLGPGSEAIAQSIGAGALIGQPDGTHQTIPLADGEVRIAVGSGLAIAGYTLIVPIDQAAALWQALTEAGAVPVGEQGWQNLRIQQGRPVPGQELTDDYNPLEAGLWHTISLTKGCYIGQETIARLHTYRGVKQQLWGIRLAGAAEAGSIVMINGEKAGTLTSCVSSEDGHSSTGLAYIRTKALESGLTQVQVNDQPGELIAVPFLSHQYLEA
ncbi:MAG: folate-binding protein [Kaiparowitsia implicata GSE-PSE-MK54-09C]|jgi:folate-binding protein YgfZ|nr:folate-binding protein [Kaiparowitsia implicata GSE-PSE-MK54-09C]